MSSTLTLSLRHPVRRVTQCPALPLILWSMGLPTELAPRATGVVSLARQYIIDLNFADRWRFSNAHFQRVPTHVFEGVARLQPAFGPARSVSPAGRNTKKMN